MAQVQPNDRLGLKTSAISRQNILNNPVALPKIQEVLEIKALEF